MLKKYYLNNSMIQQKIKNLITKVKIYMYKLYTLLGIKDKNKVNTFIVGTQKGGTSALFDYLKKSQQVTVGSKKEMGFFSQDKIFQRGSQWYSTEYKKKPDTRILLDATPEYLYYPFVPKRIHNYNPNAKIIIVLREPVSRAFSHYTMFRNINESPRKKQKTLKKLRFNTANTGELYELVKGNTFPSFSKAIREEANIEALEPSYVRRGCYFEQVQRYLKFFPRKNILILESSDLKHNKKECVKKVANFLDISSDFVTDQDFESKHIGNYKEEIKEEDKKFLQKYYEPHNQKLFNLLDKKFDW